MPTAIDTLAYLNCEACTLQIPDVSNPAPVRTLAAPVPFAARPPNKLPRAARAGCPVPCPTTLPNAPRHVSGTRRPLSMGSSDFVARSHPVAFLRSWSCFVSGATTQFFHHPRLITARYLHPTSGYPPLPPARSVLRVLESRWHGRGHSARVRLTLQPSDCERRPAPTSTISVMDP